MRSARSFPLLVALLLLPLGLAAPVAAEGGPQIPQAQVDEALSRAGANRAALESVLRHYAQGGDAQKLVAARFLVANMVGKGYVVTELRDAAGKPVPFDPLAFTDFEEARDAIEALEQEHGPLDFARDRMVHDLETITAEFLRRHVDAAFAAWRATPAGIRVGFDTFLGHVLPYRGSEEPIDDWITPLRRRYAKQARKLGQTLDADETYAWLSKDVHQRVRFDPRYYLHPTDQGFTEMGRSGQGRCEDITNMVTFAARSLALATAADYTPYWAHSDNNHAWNVLLDKDGRGSHKGNAHAAKIYRKTFEIQRDALAFQLPDGAKAPNRFLQSTSYVDVTDQYAPTTDVEVAAPRPPADVPPFAYLCVFNGGEWKAIQWSRLRGEGDGPRHARFERMGRGIVYLPAVYDGQALLPLDHPLIVEKDGSVRRLTGEGAAQDLTATSDAPRKVSPDTGEVTPKSHLQAGRTYVLKRWSAKWVDVAEATAGAEPLRFAALPADGLYWLVARESRRLERIFTIQGGRQRFW